MPEWAVSAAPISTEITLGQVSAMVLLLDSLVGILNYSIERRKQKVQQDDALAALDNWHGGHRRPRDVRCTCLRADYTFSDTDPDGESAYQVCLRDYFKTTLFLSWTAIILSLAVTVGTPVLLAAFLSGDARLGQHQVHQLLRSEQWQPVMLAYFVVSVMGLGLYLSRWSLCFWKALRRFRGRARK
ncbi:hypothetical protein PLIIFM63780_006313 [Purpureocillium lilacinum]|nr:hypothetical protein PLIIFM63780_006313 [Purpureocillium lilacinum]